MPAAAAACLRRSIQRAATLGNFGYSRRAQIYTACCENPGFLRFLSPGSRLINDTHGVRLPAAGHLVYPETSSVGALFLSLTFTGTRGQSQHHHAHTHASTAMKTFGLLAVLAGFLGVDAFVPAPSASLALRQSRTSSCASTASVGRQSRVQQQYMVAAPAAEGTVAAVPHGGTLIDLNLKTDEEKKVRFVRGCWRVGAVWCVPCRDTDFDHVPQSCGCCCSLAHPAAPFNSPVPADCDDRTMGDNIHWCSCLDPCFPNGNVTHYRRRTCCLQQ